MTHRLITIATAVFAFGCGPMERVPPVDISYTPYKGPNEQTFASNCKEFTDCGGDIVGTWNINGMCNSMVSASNLVGNPGCPKTVTSYEMLANGTLSFASDGSYVQSMISWGSVVAQSCGHTISNCVTEPDCEAKRNESQGTYKCQSTCTYTTICQVPTPKDMYFGYAVDDTTCTGSNESCECVIGLYPSTKESRGTFTADANTVTMTSLTGPSPAPFQYCVQGDTLDISLASEEGSAIVTARRSP
jgi:hypothetical protein